jgi:archaellum component FlaF (FlaF/FlaG flagellin family)
MALREETLVDKIEIVENGSVQVRTANIVLKDGVQIARSNQRHVIVPGADYSNEDAKVQAVCGAVQTSEVVTAYETAMAAV